jgi:protein-disulfide isomerase
MSKTVKNEVAQKSNTPLLIIGGVLLLAILGGLYFYSSSSKNVAAGTNGNVNKTPTANTASKDPGIPPNAPSGATPPNQAGSPTASVTLEEFADFQCPACATAHPVMNEIKSIYGTRIHFIFRNNPLSIAAHDKAYDAAVAVEAAGMQGKFWDLQNLLYSNQQAWTAAPTYKQIWKDYATKIGLDIPKWENDIAGIAAKSRVDSDLARGKAIPVTSTPTLFVNGRPVEFKDMNVNTLKTIIDAELAKTAPQPAANTAASAPAAPANTSK